MRHFRATRALLCSLAVLSICTLACAQQDYEIKLNRPSKAGDRHRVKANVSQTGRTVVHIGSERTPPRTDEIKIELEAVATVLTVSESGQPTQISYEVAKCTKTEEGQTADLVAPGKVIIASDADGDEGLKFKDGTMSDEVRSRLALLINGLEDSEDEDESFGTTERKKVGDTWPANSEAMAREIAEHSEGAKPSAIKGKSRLESVSNVQGVPCLQIVSSITIRGLMPGGDDLPPGLKVQNSILRVEMTGMYPVDVNRSVLSGSFTMDMEAELSASSATSGSPMKISRAMKRQFNFTQSPLDPAP